MLNYPCGGGGAAWTRIAGTIGQGMLLVGNNMLRGLAFLSWPGRVAQPASIMNRLAGKVTGNDLV